MSIFQDAKSGDPEATQNLLQQSLGKNDLSIQVKARDNNLHIAIYYANPPEKDPILKATRLLLNRLKVSVYDLAIVYGYELTASSPDWKGIIKLRGEHESTAEKATGLVTNKDKEIQLVIPVEKNIERKADIIGSSNPGYSSTPSSAQRFLQRMHMNRMRQVGRRLNTIKDPTTFYREFILREIQRFNTIKDPTLDAIKLLKISIKKVRPVYFPLMVISIPIVILRSVELQSFSFALESQSLSSVLESQSFIYMSLGSLICWFLRTVLETIQTMICRNEILNSQEDFWTGRLLSKALEVIKSYSVFGMLYFPLVAFTGFFVVRLILSGEEQSR
jgi:hypothetical protein